MKFFIGFLLLASSFAHAGETWKCLYWEVDAENKPTTQDRFVVTKTSTSRLRVLRGRGYQVKVTDDEFIFTAIHDKARKTGKLKVQDPWGKNRKPALPSINVVHDSGVQAIVECK